MSKKNKGRKGLKTGFGRFALVTPALLAAATAAMNVMANPAFEPTISKTRRQMRSLIARPGDASSTTTKAT